MNLRIQIKQHLKANRWQYTLISIIFLLGLILGNYKVIGLEGGVRSELLGLIDNYVQRDLQEAFTPQSIFWHAFFNQVKTVLAIWFLGLTVIGLPLILAVVFMRGFSLGFTGGFLLQEKAGTGVLICILSIFPHNIVYIPFLLVSAVLAINFSYFIIKGRNSSLLPLSKGLIMYSILMVLLLVVFLAGAFIEVYLSPWLLSLFFK
jgi:stage II sporulation protein M